VVRALAAVVVTVAALAPSASAASKTGIAFGRDGGNIRPYSVSISVDGAVRASGPVEVRRTKLTRLEIAELNRLAVTTGFTHLEQRTNCPGTLPDVAATYIRVGARTVHVHGNCVAPYRKLWRALQQAARISN
jgi:hypothetical protein